MPLNEDGTYPLPPLREGTDVDAATRAVVEAREEVGFARRIYSLVPAASDRAEYAALEMARARLAAAVARHPNAFVCDECGRHRLRPEDDAYNLVDDYDRLTCGACVSACNDCGHVEESADMLPVRSGRAICQECYSSGDYVTCENCSDIVSEDDARYHEDREQYYCRGCFRDIECEEQREERQESDFLRPYHESRGNHRFVHSEWTRAHAGRFLGVELEVECVNGANREDRAQQVHALANAGGNDFLTVEEDGSLDNGIELITQPMGLDSQRELWARVLAPAVAWKKNIRSHDTTTCGLHVHVSREGVSSFTLSKAVCFVHNPANETLIRAIARRYNTGYCNATPKVIGTAHIDDGNRYQAVNLCNYKTIEFRIFRGTLKPEAVLAAVEFCTAVLDFAAQATALKLDTQAFLAFIQTPEMRADTKYLRPYLVARGMTNADGGALVDTDGEESGTSMPYVPTAPRARSAAINEVMDRMASTTPTHHSRPAEWDAGVAGCDCDRCLERRRRAIALDSELQRQLGMQVRSIMEEYPFTSLGT